MMAKNKVQFQKGYSLFEFLKDYGTEAQCENALFTWRFPNGFICPECSNKTCFRMKRRQLAEYCFRFNRHFDFKSMLVEFGHTVVASPPMPYRLLKLAEGHG